MQMHAAGVRLFLVTNSHYDYCKHLMDFAYGCVAAAPGGHARPSLIVADRRTMLLLSLHWLGVAPTLALVLEQGGLGGAF